jgi:Xaa-Pro dipeptidase
LTSSVGQGKDGRSVHQEVLEKQVAAMRAAGLDGLVALSPENFAYLSGFVVPSQAVLRWRHAATVATADGRVSVLSVDMEASTVRNRLPRVDLRVWQEFEGNAMEVLSELLADLGLQGGRIGVEMDYVPARDMERLRQLLPGARWEPAHELFDRMRMVKSAREVEILRRLSRITDRAIHAALALVSAGDTEFDLASALVGELYRLGAEHHKFLIVATGERSRFPNVGPSDRRLQPGDLIRLEIFGVLGGYHAGVCRTGVVGDAAPEVERIYRNLAECRQIVLEAMRPMASSADVYRKFLERFEELGYDPIDFVGHGIGLHVHEEPYLGRHGDWRLEEGMVFGVEPLLYGPHYGLQIKDVVAVRESGATVLSDVAPTDEMIRVT